MNWLAATWAAKGTVPKKPTSNAQISQNHHSLPESFHMRMVDFRTFPDSEQRSGWKWRCWDTSLRKLHMETHGHIHGESSNFIIWISLEIVYSTPKPNAENPWKSYNFPLRNDDHWGPKTTISTISRAHFSFFHQGTHLQHAGNGHPQIGLPGAEGAGAWHPGVTTLAPTKKHHIV